ncbi:hypothetical protein LPUS_03391 [Lasallia pustulata]|uniref:LysM domain-containing protein n=1 Tax=Lasallia pustulata TaxID=136370 RepID=A0A1W5CUN1_9LECA|nr:hypothetical protein LPUS_03391 [Lasallia pustulata]
MDFINSCTYLTGAYGVLITDLLSWNLSLTADYCTLKLGYSYCIELNPLPNSTFVTPVNCVQVDNIHNGTIPSCSYFTTVHGYDNNSYPCASIADDYSITVDEIITWNSWVGSNCDTGLYAGLSSEDQNAVCVGVNSTVPTATASSGPTATTSAGATIGPTQTGIVLSCIEYYTVQSGDSCASIEAKYATTFNQFYTWNPAGKCKNPSSPLFGWQLHLSCTPNPQVAVIAEPGRNRH